MKGEKEEKSKKIDKINDKIKYKIWSIDKYDGKTNIFIENNFEEKKLSELKKILINNNNYHLRIDPIKNYIFFGDCDGYQEDDPKKFINMLINFLHTKYDIKIKNSSVSYTINKSKIGSYHYSIPSIYCSCNKLKEIHTNFLKEYKDIFIYKNNNNNTVKVIDTSIYSKKWFRYPNQTKENKINTKHIIIVGKIVDFIVEHIPSNSISIEDKLFVDNNNNKQSSNITKIEPKIIEVDDNKKIIEEFSEEISKYTFSYEEIEQLVMILSLNRCDEYNDWLSVGICLYNIDNTYLQIWVKWSKTSDKYNIGECEKKWKTFKNTKDGLKIGSLLQWVKNDDEIKYEDFLKKKKLNSLLISKFPKDALILGESINVGNKCTYTNLTNKKCFIKGDCHNDFNPSMYVETLHNYMTIKCKHPECFGKIYPCNHVLLSKNEMNVVFNGDINITINNDDELVEFQKLDIYENEQVNNLVFNGLNGKSSSFAKIIHYYYENNYNFGEDDEWYCFNGQRWASETKTSRIRSMIEPKLKDIYDKLLNYYEKGYGNIKQIYAVKQIKKIICDTNMKNNIVTELIDLYLENNNIYRNFTQNLDNNFYLIGFENGVYDLQKFEFRDGKHDDFITMSVKYNYSNEHTDEYENLLQFLNDILPNKDDLDYALTYVSIGLVGNMLELFTVLTGSGRNGKSKFIELIKITFGNYFSSVNSTMFTRGRPDVTSPDPGLLNLAKKRIVIASEPEKNSKLNSGFIKFITGRDSTTLRNCHQNKMVEFMPKFLTFLICNDIPDCDEIDNAFSKRLRCINFPNEFVDNPSKANQKKINTNINEKFKYWKMDFMLLLIEYYKKYLQTNNLTPTKNILKWTNKYKEDTDIYLSFLNENTEDDENEKLHCVQLYALFKIWFKENNPNSKIPNNKEFVNGLRKHKIVEKVRIETKISLGIKNIKMIDN